MYSKVWTVLCKILSVKRKWEMHYSTHMKQKELLRHVFLPDVSKIFGTGQNCSLLWYQWNRKHKKEESSPRKEKKYDAFIQAWNEIMKSSVWYGNKWLEWMSRLIITSYSWDFTCNILRDRSCSRDGKISPSLTVTLASQFHAHRPMFFTGIYIFSTIF